MTENLSESTVRIAVIGLGYVGLPLAFEFSKKYSVIGYDIDPERIKTLKKGDDQTQQIKKNETTIGKVYAYCRD